MDDIHHLSYMSLALKLAKRGRYSVAPNPMAGCVLVKNNQIIGQGWHQKFGGAHAEINALRNAGIHTKGATAYITLEPCCHFGKTSPCTTALIEAGIKEVYVACVDPNPLVSGKGIAALEAFGITVHVGLAQAKAKKLNEVFFYFIKHKRPFVIAKWAMSLDGKTITHDQDTREISNTISQQNAHDLRHEVSAILIGARTAIKDDPQLTVRHAKTVAKQHPLRIVLTRKGNLPLNLKLFSNSLPGKTVVMTTTAAQEHWLNQLQQQHIETVILPSDVNGHIVLPELLDELGRREISSLLVEGGMQVHEQFFREQLVNKIKVYIAPVLIGSNAKKQIVSHTQIHRLGGDHLLTASYEEQPCLVE